MALRCPVCGEELEDEMALREHDHQIPEAWERSGAGFSCPTCGAGFDSEEDLIAHEATAHHRDRDRSKTAGSRVRPAEPRDHRPPRHWPQG